VRYGLSDSVTANCSEADASAVVSEIAHLFVKELPPAWASSSKPHGTVRLEAQTQIPFAPTSSLRVQHVKSGQDRGPN
jgi:hypothetical protein